MAETVFLDACVLFPRVVRTLILGVAEAGLLRPAWSPRVLEEWRIAAAREGASAEDAAREAAAELRRLPGGVEVEPDLSIEAGIELPDPTDAHVLAAAVAARATVLMTFNMRDFPARRLARFGVVPRHPDGYFWELLSHRAGPVRAIVDRLVEAADREGLGGRKLLKRSGLPRLGRAWAEG